MQKKFLGGGKFYFLKKKRSFFGRFFCFLQPAFGHGRLGHPQSLEYYEMVIKQEPFFKTFISRNTIFAGGGTEAPTNIFIFVIFILILT